MAPIIFLALMLRRGEVTLDDADRHRSLICHPSVRRLGVSCPRRDAGVAAIISRHPRSWRMAFVAIVVLCALMVFFPILVSGLRIDRGC